MKTETREEKDKQIELIAQYLEGFYNPQDARRIRELLRERDEALKIIKYAPHARNCPHNKKPSNEVETCNCFKSEVPE